jgi:hypothetical protein
MLVVEKLKFLIILNNNNIMSESIEVDIIGKQLEAICLYKNTYEEGANLERVNPPSSPVSNSDEPTKSPQTLRKLIKFKKPLKIETQNESADVSSEASVSVLPTVETNEVMTCSSFSTKTPPVRKIRLKKTLEQQLHKNVVFPNEASEEAEVSISQATNELELIIGKFICGIFEDHEEKCQIGEKSDSFDLPPKTKWVKPICFEGHTKWKDYPKKNHFKRVAWIVPDIEVVEEPSKPPKKGKSKSTKQPGDKRRQTLIQFVNTISVDLWKEPVEWIYILVIDGYIVKIGGTRVGLDERCRSYLSGHCVPEKGGKSVSTNAFIYHTFHWYLEQGMSIEMYGFRIEPKQDTDSMLGFTETYLISRYHVWEALLLGEFERLYGKKPPLSSNSDPKYRK